MAGAVSGVVLLLLPLAWLLGFASGHKQHRERSIGPFRPDGGEPRQPASSGASPPTPTPDRTPAAVVTTSLSMRLGQASVGGVTQRTLRSPSNGTEPGSSTKPEGGSRGPQRVSAASDKDSGGLKSKERGAVRDVR